MPGRPGRWDAEVASPIGLRRIAFDFIAEFSSPENVRHSGFLKCARELVTLVGDGEQPVVCDSFAGGGSIPLEAVRIGCEAIGSDLNPVACLILKTELELLPRRGDELVESFLQGGLEIESRFRERMQKFFAPESRGEKAVAYFWARQITCEAPRCGVTFPLVSSFWLCKRSGREMAMGIEEGGRKGAVRCVVFKPTRQSDVPRGTVLNGNGRCPICGTVLANDRLRAQLRRDHGGITGAQLCAVVTENEQTGMKTYRVATRADLNAVDVAVGELERMINGGPLEGMHLFPDELIPHSELRRISAPLYGCRTWGDLFLLRQRLSLAILGEEITRFVEQKGQKDLLPLFALAFGKVVRHWNSNARWHTKSENVAGAFGRQAIPMAYLFPEQNPLACVGAGCWRDAVTSVSSAARAIVGLENGGQTFRADACDVPLPSESVNVWFTDPPYYDAVAYGHLAEFFYVWLRRLMPADALFQTDVIDKREECVVDRPHSQSPSQKGADWFEVKMGKAMAEGRRLLHRNGVASVVFAHKTTEGWEAIITAMLKAGWVITASWPIATERGARLNARDNASLATSVHLICRPRPEDADVGDWSEVLRELPRRVGSWMELLQGEGVRGADLVFACLGPALEVFSRYSKVESADGREIQLEQYLAKVWEVVGRAALEQVLGTKEAKARNGASGALEEDARLSALFLWTLQSTEVEDENGNDHGDGEDTEEGDEEEEEEAPKKKKKGFSLIFDVVRRFAQPLGIDLPKWEGRIIETDKGVVRLLAVTERAKQLFGADGADEIDEREFAAGVKNSTGWLPGMEPEARPPKVRGRRIKISEEAATQAGATTLDKVHAAMLLQSTGMTHALRALVKAEIDRGPDFLRLANALSALYPTGSGEKRLVDAMLLAVPK